MRVIPNVSHKKLSVQSESLCQLCTAEMTQDDDVIKSCHNPTHQVSGKFHCLSITLGFEQERLT